MARIMDHWDSLPLVNMQWSTGKVAHGNVFRWLVLGNFILPSSVVIHRGLFDRCGGFDPEFKSAEETEFFPQTGETDGVFLYRPAIGWIPSRSRRTYRQHSSPVEQWYACTFQECSSRSDHLRKTQACGTSGNRKALCATILVPSKKS